MVTQSSTASIKSSRQTSSPGVLRSGIQGSASAFWLTAMFFSTQRLIALGLTHFSFCASISSCTVKARMLSAFRISIGQFGQAKTPGLFGFGDARLPGKRHSRWCSRSDKSTRAQKACRSVGVGCWRSIGVHHKWVWEAASDWNNGTCLASQLLG